ncbi:MAG: hypothetical protein RIQ54_425 [Candidatus Parcubacteria bacterium]|jgi:O-antigen/teichoic acid export membrane protein
MWKNILRFFFKNQTTGQTILKNSFWLFWGSVVSRIIKSLIIIYAARVLGAAGWGAFSYTLSLAALLTIFIDFGINGLITRESSGANSDRRDSYFVTALVIKSLFLLFVLVGVFFIAPYFVHEHRILTLLPLMALIVGFDSLRDFGAALSRGFEKMEIEAFIQIATNILIVVAGFIALRISATEESLAWGYALGTGVGMVLAFVPFASYFRNFRAKFSLSLVWSILARSWSLGVMSLLGSLLINTDMIMIGWYRSLEDVGIYSAANRIVQLVYILPAPIATAFFPQLVRAFGDPKRFSFILQKSFLILTLLSVPFTIGGALLSGQILQFLYGTKYDAGAASFILLNLTYIPIFFGITMSNALFAAQRERALLFAAIFSFLGNFILNLFLIPRFGITGSAASTLINLTLNWFFMMYLLGHGAWKHIFLGTRNIFIAGCIMGGVIVLCNYLSFPVIATIAIASCVYFLALLLSKEKTIFEAFGFLRKGVS